MGFVGYIYSIEFEENLGWHGLPDVWGGLTVVFGGYCHAHPPRTCVHHVSEHLSTMSPVYTEDSSDRATRIRN